MTCKDCLYFKRCVVLGVVLGVELDMKHDIVRLMRSLAVFTNRRTRTRR